MQREYLKIMHKFHQKIKIVCCSFSENSLYLRYKNRGVHNMNFKKPEECGISSASIEKLVRRLEEKKLFTHSLIIAKGDNIIFENYWKPFHKDFLHRQYSVTKSIVALGVGFVNQEGLIDLDDPISKYFPEAELANCREIKEQTIREMLTMRTSLLAGHWINDKAKDRVEYYFKNASVGNKRPSGTIFQYDSTGSFILCAMIERVTGKRFMDYMRERLFDKIGVSKEATCLTCPGGHSWGDSALLCTSRDLLYMAKFTMDGGKFNGEQILSADYVKAATAKQTDNNQDFIYEFNTFGYGYQIWKTYDNSFFFNGMGAQLAVCVPDKDLILIYNSDNQGNNFTSKQIVIDSFFEYIVRPEQNTENADRDYASLMEYTKDMQLLAIPGNTASPFAEKVNGKTFVLEDNPMKIKWIKLTLSDEKCKLDYENATGAKAIEFAMGKNAFGIFPEEGYSDLVGAEYAKGHYYKCAASAIWSEEQKLSIHVQAIDTYFGKLNIHFGFKDENTVGVYMSKTAEGFFNEYQGYAAGQAK
jgi:CubicO group peptidase (beta-lactamase class C family)